MSETVHIVCRLWTFYRSINSHKGMGIRMSRVSLLLMRTLHFPRLGVQDVSEEEQYQAHLQTEAKADVDDDGSHTAPANSAELSRHMTDGKGNGHGHANSNDGDSDGAKAEAVQAARVAKE